MSSNIDFNIEKFHTKGKRISDKYINQVEKYISSHRFKNTFQDKINATGIIELKSLDSSGIDSVVYRTDGLAKNVVLKFGSYKNVFGDYNGLRIAYKNDISVPKPIYGEKYTEDYCFCISEFINAPLLSEHLMENPHNLKPVIEFGKTVRRLNNIKGIGYGPIKDDSCEGQLAENEDIRKKFITPENINYIIENGLLTISETSKIISILEGYEYKNEGHLNHRDVRNENCLWKNGPVLIDFSAGYGDPLYDLAVYRHKVLSRKLTYMWDAFFTGYGKDIDEERLNLITGNILVYKLASLHKQRIYYRLEWIIAFLKRLHRQSERI